MGTSTDDRRKIHRIQDFNARKSPLSITVGLPLPLEIRERLREAALKLPPDEFPSAERLLPLWDEYLAYHRANDPDDDSIPCIYPRQYDQGIYGAMFGADMDFLLDPDGGWGWASSNSKPFEDKSYEEILALRFDPEHPWLRRMKTDLAFFADTFRAQAVVATVITVDGFNFGHQIRGSAIFGDIYDRPHDLKALMSLAADINIQFVEFQRKASGETCQDGAVVFGGLHPNRTPAMSVDTYNLCSPAVYEEFGRPYHQRLIDHFGGGSFHLHGNGRHLLPELAQLSGFVHVSICDDGARVRAFDDRKNIHRTAKDLLISIACGKDEFMRAMRDRSLVPARYAVGGCETLQEATRLLERFRNCRM